jgi:hypothetical protein
MFNKPALEEQHSVAKIMSVTIMNWVTPKAEAKHELLFNGTTRFE